MRIGEREKEGGRGAVKSRVHSPVAFLCLVRTEMGEELLD